MTDLLPPIPQKLAILLYVVFWIVIIYLFWRKRKKGRSSSKGVIIRDVFNIKQLVRILIGIGIFVLLLFLFER